MIITGDFHKDGKALKDEVQKQFKADLSLLPSRIVRFAWDRCILSGGCFAAIMHGEKVNDWDLWCADDADIPEMERILNTYTKEESDSIVSENPAYMDQFVDGKIMTANAITLKNRIQFIKLSKFSTAKQSFDFEHCRISYHPSTNMLYMSKNQYEYIRWKKLVQTESSPISERRLSKFVSRGWSQ